MECRLDYRVQNSLSLRLRLLFFSSMRAMHTLTDYHFQLGFNFAILSTLCLPRRIFLSRYTFNILYFSYPSFIYRPSHSPYLTIIKAFRGKPLRITALDICFNFHPSVTSYKSCNQAPSHGDLLGREYTKILHWHYQVISG